MSGTSLDSHTRGAAQDSPHESTVQCPHQNVHSTKLQKSTLRITVAQSPMSLKSAGMPLSQGHLPKPPHVKLCGALQ